MNEKNGFTLIELLIAISIIAIVVAVTVSTALVLQRNSRDAKRKSDLASIRNALQQYYADQQFYPTSTSSLGNYLDLSTLTSLKNSDRNPVVPTTTKTYLNQVPKEPNSSTNYLYQALPLNCDDLASGVRCIDYCLYAKIEFVKPTDSSDPAFNKCSLNNYGAASLKVSLP